MRAHFYRRMDHDELDERMPRGYQELANDYIKPPCHHYSHSNPESQGALIAWYGELRWYNPKTHEAHSVYSDRLAQGQPEIFKRVCDIAGTGPDAWAFRVNRNDRKLAAMCKAAFELTE